LALVSHLPFDSFEEEENSCKAYIPSSNIQKNFNSLVENISQNHNLSYQIKDIPYVNWNKEWESNFDPVIIDDICTIKANFHNEQELPKTDYTITISPKMAFGTGHHATTYLMIKTMASIDFTNKKVFDYGCGTGILSVFAEFINASSIFGIDIEPLAIENSLEHASLNSCTKCSFEEGNISIVKDDNEFDIILANINRNVILESLNSLYNKLSKNGTLLLSGILEKDWETLSHSTDFQKFSFKAKFEKDGWLCIHITK